MIPATIIRAAIILGTFILGTIPGGACSRFQTVDRRNHI
jgi:hypothetical protein